MAAELDMNMNRSVFLLLVALAVAKPISAAPITLVNHGFETGTGGWVSTGDVTAVGARSVVAFNNVTWDLTPSGTQMAALN